MSGKEVKLAKIYVIIAGILWGCMGILQRTMNESQCNSMEIVFLRAFVTAICLLLIVFIFKREKIKIKMKDIWCFVGTGMLSIVFFSFCYYSCMQYTTLSVAATLLYTAPSFVMILSYFLFKEKITKRKIIALLLSFLGCCFVSGAMSIEGLGFKGLLFGLGAGFGYALYSIFGKMAINRGYESITITTYTFIFALIGCVFFINPLETYKKVINQNIIIIVFEVLLIIAVSVIAYLLYTEGLSKLENSQSSILASVEPAAATIVGLVVYREHMSLMMWTGVCLVLASIIYVNKK